MAKDQIEEQGYTLEEDIPQELESYNFPAEGVTVQAKSTEDALKKLAKLSLNN